MNTSMIYTYNKLLTVLLFGLISLATLASDGVFRFLDLPVSSRMAAMGGKNVTNPNGDISFALFNPALLNEQSHTMLSLNMANYLADIKFGSAVYGMSYGKNHFAAGVQFVDYGTFKETTDANEIIGEFTAKDMAISLIYSRTISEAFSAGITLKPIFSAYERYSSFGAAVDMGLHYRSSSDLFSGGIAVRNLGFQFQGYYIGEDGQHREALPLDVQIGISQKLQHAPLRFSLTLHQLNKWNLYYTDNNSGMIDYERTEMIKEVSFIDMAFRHAIIGIEFLPGKNVYLAASYNHRRHQELAMNGFRSMSGFSFGGGIRISKFQIGFGTSQFQVGNSAYLFSVSTSLNEFKL
jgi:hypothetical protein